MIIKDMVDFLNKIVEIELAAEWDNVGLLIGDPETEISNVMVCLTITPEVIQEAVSKGTNFIITHHPFPFHSFKRVNDTYEDKMLWDLISNKIAVYSAHTAFDSCEDGINEIFATRFLRLIDRKPLNSLGHGRWGEWKESQSISEIIHCMQLGFEKFKFINTKDKYKRAAVACGSGESLLMDAYNKGCDLFVTGEMTFHNCLKAKGLGMGVILTGHYDSEIFGMLDMGKRLHARFSSIEIYNSKKDKSPIQFLTSKYIEEDIFKRYK